MSAAEIQKFLDDEATAAMIAQWEEQQDFKDLGLL